MFHEKSLTTHKSPINKTGYRNRFILFLPLLLLLNIVLSSSANANTRGAKFMDMCLKDINGNFPAACLSYVSGLQEGLFNGARAGALRASEISEVSKKALLTAEEENAGVFLAYCETAPLDNLELAIKLYEHLAANRSLLSQPVNLTLRQLLSQLSPEEQCSQENNFQFNVVETTSGN